jgi:hypothetical protein
MSIWIILATQALAGVVLGFTSDLWGGGGTASSNGSTRGFGRAMGWAAAGLGLQVAAGTTVVLVTGSGPWRDPSLLLAPLALVGVLGWFGVLSGYLVTLLIGWPLAKLAAVVIRFATGSAPHPVIVPAVALALSVAGAVACLQLADATSTGLTAVADPWRQLTGWPDPRGAVAEQVWRYLGRVLLALAAVSAVGVVVRARWPRERLTPDAPPVAAP